MSKSVVLAALSVAAAISPLAAPDASAQSPSTLHISIDESGRPIVSGARLMTYDERARLHDSKASPMVKNAGCGFHCASDVRS